MPDRFDNISTTDLIAREIETQAELDAVRQEIAERLMDECPIDPGMVYRFRADLLNYNGKPSHLRNRRILIAYIRAAGPRWSTDRWHVSVQGFLSNPRSKSGDGFNIKIFVMRGWDRLDLSTAEKGPRDYRSEKGRRTERPAAQV